MDIFHANAVANNDYLGAYINVMLKSMERKIYG